jgi:phosphomannomutase
VNVVTMMKKTKAVIGGEGNGGVIYPALHYGRDALVGVALFLTFLAKSGKTCSALRKTYPEYYISKNKIDTPAGFDTRDIIDRVHSKYKSGNCNTIDGLRIDFEKEWVHLRRSNTEPVIRIYAESRSPEKAEKLARKIMNDINEITGK